MSTIVKVQRGRLILDADLGLRANCRGPKGSDIPRAPWSSFNILIISIKLCLFFLSVGYAVGYNILTISKILSLA